MCGRFTLKTNPDSWAQLLLPLVVPQLPPGEWKPRYNIAPTQDILAISGGQEQHMFSHFRWGLVPFWAGELSIGNRMINARRETLSEKKSFAKLLEDRRCLIVADGYYEWQKRSTGSKRPCWISPASGGVTLLAGLWDSNSKATGAVVRSCTLITTAANDALSEIHDRMPVVISPERAGEWLDKDVSSVQASGLLGPAANDYFCVREVATLVNSPKNDSPACIEPVPET